MNLPVKFIEKYQQLLGEEATAFLTSLQTLKVQKGFRLNPLKPNFKQVKIDLSQPLAYVATGYLGAVSGRSLEHQTGYLYSQEPSAMYVAEVAAVQPGERILDLCAAPGGKSTQLAGKLQGQGLLVANEIDAKRARVLAENLERTGATNVQILNEQPAKLAKKFKEFFDKVLVDAPCSGEGMFRKDPSAITYWSPGYPRECANRQREILKSAWQMLKPGGQLIYSTCTFAPEEDEQIVAWLLAEYPTLKLLPLKKYSGMDSGRPEFADGRAELTKTIRLFPHHFQGEGHFIAKFQDMRPQSTQKPKKSKKRFNQFFRVLNPSERGYWQEFCQLQFGRQLFEFADLRVLNDKLYYVKPHWPDLTGLRVVRPGLELGVFKKKRFEPAYGFALSLDPTLCQRVIELSSDQWNQYVQGHPLQLSSIAKKNGWYLLTCQQKAFSFGKVTNQVLKNYFPKGLRLRYGQR
ncbi:RsmB/NOP family class I SAM-dependent RNA methyltransferase [Liquorilactobacillus sicerae]|uniref:RsmB/NOP family class I SAM-dependent RNA methyltransferase n=1 Tax=Liquorilactobacillus sicerae TaxID=1416943 RepID=UPI0024812C91|nr:RsmB/NOP family class I SAM-dependent RNA methyltransferase [Liquorilactobacillus sicerae]